MRGLKTEQMKKGLKNFDFVHKISNFNFVVSFLLVIPNCKYLQSIP